MLTLSDINTVTKSYDGSTYSDLYKDVYGCRPRDVMFTSIEEFDQNYKYLVGELNIQNKKERDRQAQNWVTFMGRLLEIRKIVYNCTWIHAIEILADAEDELEDMQYYGYERLEWHFDLKFGSIKQFLTSVKEQL